MLGIGVLQIAELLGIKLVDRDAALTWIYNGQDIALWYTRNLWFDDESTRKKVYFTDHDILHELCHWIVADECQRDLPEYGLSPAPNDVNAYGEFRLPNGDVDYTNPYDGVVDMSDQIDQEIRTQQLCIGLGLLFNIPSKLGEDAQGIDKNWRSYYRYKVKAAGY